MRNIHPIFDAIKKDSLEEVRHYIQKDSSCLAEEDRAGDNPLMEALYRQKGEIVCELLSYPIDVKKRNKEGDTVLLRAMCVNMPLSIVQFLVEKGSDVNEKNDGGSTPRFNQITNHFFVSIKRCPNERAEIDHEDTDGDSFYSMYEGGKFECSLDFLLEHGRFIEEETKRKFKALRLEKIFK